MIRFRLKRIGRKGQPSYRYRIVLTKSTSKRDGGFIMGLSSYNSPSIDSTEGQYKQLDVLPPASPKYLPLLQFPEESLASWASKVLASLLT